LDALLAAALRDSPTRGSIPAPPRGLGRALGVRIPRTTLTVYCSLRERRRGSEGARGLVRVAGRQAARARTEHMRNCNGRERDHLSPPSPGWRRVRVTLDPGSPMSMALTRSMCRMEMSWRKEKKKRKGKGKGKRKRKEKEKGTKEETAAKHHGWASVRRSLSVDSVLTQCHNLSVIVPT